VNINEMTLTLVYARDGDYRDLIKSLRNKEYQLTMAERRFLASLLENAKIKIPGRKKKRPNSSRLDRQRLRAAEHYALLHHGCDIPRKKALKLTADECRRGSEASVVADIAFAKKKGMWRAYEDFGRRANAIWKAQALDK
jgi:hypothetical protein